MSDKKTNNSRNCETVKIKYKFKDDYNPIYINGAYGGVNPAGEIVAHFYFERFPLPNQEIVSNEGVDFIPSDLPISAIRYVESGVILSTETAKLLADWLMKQVELAQNRIKDSNPLDD